MNKKPKILGKQKIWNETGVYFTYVLITFLVIAPALWITIESFKTRPQIFAWPPIWIPWPGTFYNFTKLFTSAHFGRALFNSIVVASVSSFIVIGFAAMAAYGFARFSFRYKYLLLVLLIGLQMVPVTANIIPLFFITHKLSLYNTRLGIIILLAGVHIPFSIWILKGFFESIPVSIEECAMLDGANRIQVLTRILLPLILPGLSAVFFITFVGSWNNFIIPMVIIGDSSKQVATVQAYNLLAREAEFPGLIAAAAVLTTFPMILFFYGFQKLFIRGLTTGYTK